MNYLMVIIFILLIICFYCIIMNVRINKKYKLTVKRLLEYEKIIDDQGKKNHEYNNQLMVLKGYINDKDKLLEYLETIIDDHKTGQNYEIRQLSKLPSGGIKEMLYYKLSKMNKLNIKYYIYISENIKQLFDKCDVRLYKDITKIFGVFIDNAIDAAKDLNQKEIDLDFKNDNNYFTITISNSCDDNIDIEKFGKNRYTTKGIGHGFGLSIVKEIVKSNDRIETITEKETNIFTQIIMVDFRDNN